MQLQSLLVSPGPRVLLPHRRAGLQLVDRLRLLQSILAHGHSQQRDKGQMKEGRWCVRFPKPVTRQQGLLCPSPQSRVWPAGKGCGGMEGGEKEGERGREGEREGGRVSERGCLRLCRGPVPAALVPCASPEPWSPAPVALSTAQNSHTQGITASP